MNSEIMMYSGRLVDPFDLQPDDFDIADIARALSMQCRYSGHVKFFYSVAQHSWLLSYLVPVELRRAALLHDVCEAFCSDVPNPVKRLMPQFTMLEDTIIERAFARFGLSLAEYDMLRPYDIAICIPEMESLLGRVDPWLLENFDRPAKQVFIEPMAPLKSRDLFLERFRELFPGEEVRRAA